jgi:hypothetical protein
MASANDPQTTATASDAPAGDVSPLQRQAPVPEGVEEQLAFGGMGAGGSCRSAPKATITMELRSELELEIGSKDTLCFAGSEPNRMIKAEARLPDGSVRRNNMWVNDAGIGAWEWYAMLSDPLGTYTISAVQGRRTATATINIIATSRPAVIIRPPARPAGTSFEILLAGFRPHQRGLLPFYRDRATGAEAGHNYAHYLTAGVRPVSIPNDHYLW